MNVTADMYILIECYCLQRIIMLFLILALTILYRVAHIIAMLQIRKLKLSEAKKIAQSHKVNKE